MELLDKLIRGLNRLLVLIGGVFLVGMVVLTCSNIVLRAVWVPVRGTFELMGYFGAVTTAFALGYTQLRRGHIAVDVLISTFGRGPRRVVEVINHLAGSLFFIVAGWQVGRKAQTLYATGEVTETLRIVYYPFTYAVALGCLVLSLVMAAELLRLLTGRRAGGAR